MNNLSSFLAVMKLIPDDRLLDLGPFSNELTIGRPLFNIIQTSE
jgi:hypothetical protein